MNNILKVQNLNSRMEIEKLFEDFPLEEDLLNIIMHTSTTVWQSELGEKDIENWLSNFTGDIYNVKYERLLAMWLLSHFTYYNQLEVKHLCRVLYSDLLHLIVSGHETSKLTVEEEIKLFFNKSNIISPEKTSGSGGFIAYYFRQENQLPMTLFNFSMENINDTIENIILIDDVTLTEGEQGQMHRFLKDVTAKYSRKKFYLLSMISSEASYNHLKSLFNIEIVTAIKLDNRDKAFHKESDIFSSFKGLIKPAQIFVEHYGKKINIPGITPLGYMDGQYTFGFFYNTPNNCLPIFWGQINGWKPVLRRYRKNYRTQNYLHHERYV